jgi:hypothetical protein
MPNILHRILTLSAILFALSIGYANAPALADSGLTSLSSGDPAMQVPDLLQQGTKDYLSHDYASGYKNADHAVRIINAMSESHLKVSLLGSALAIRAWNERHLSQGDSNKDGWAAYHLLKECVGYDDLPQQLIDSCHTTIRASMIVMKDW